MNSGRDILDPATGYRLRVEVSYDANGLPAVRGSSGSIRPDVVLSRKFVNPQGVQTWQPVHIYDLKTGLRGISGPWANRADSIVGIGPAGVSEIRPG